MRRSSVGSKNGLRAIRQSSFTPPEPEPSALSERYANLVANPHAARFSQQHVHHALEALEASGVVPLREHRAPERILSWIDAEFGGTASLDAATGGIWIAQDPSGPIGFAAYDTLGLEYHWMEHWSQRRSAGTFGPFGVVPRARGKGIGSTLLAASMFSLAERGYREALIPAVAPADVPYFERNADALLAEPVDLGRGGRRWRATVLASGHGGNLQSVIDASTAGEIPLDVAAVVVNRPGAYAIERAAAAGIEASVVTWHRREESRDAYDARVIAAVARTQPDLVLLLGWMHVLPPAFVECFPQALNLHPAFLPLDFSLDTVTMPDGSSLPAYRGAHAFDDALNAGALWSGATVHRVNAAVDRGEVFARLPLRVDGETRSVLEGRLAQIERTVVKTAIHHWAYRQR